MMDAQKKSVGLAKGAAAKGVGRKGKRGVSAAPRSKPTLAETGIDKNLAKSNALKEIEMGRRPIFETAMSASARMKRYRQKRRERLIAKRAKWASILGTKRATMVTIEAVVQALEADRNRPEIS